MSHSPEPWRLETETQTHISPLGRCVLIYAAGGETIYVDSSYGDDGDKILANAQRIIACVNFCGGFPTEFLEKHRLMTFENAGKLRILRYVDAK